MTLTRRTALSGLIALPIALPVTPESLLADISATTNLITKARAQVGVTTLYDPAYVRLDYPGGDVARDRGVCIDVIIRAYRDAFDYDFQQVIHEDMAANFAAYPKIWGLTRTDRNIDHRRVPNLETWLARYGHEVSDRNWQPGDILTCRIGNLPHLGIISDRKDRDGRFLAIHNVGQGTREDDRIWAYTDYRRFRFLPATSSL